MTLWKIWNLKGEIMKFHKDLIGQKYIPGVFWLILGLLLIFFWGKAKLLNEIQKNSWTPVQAVLTDIRIVESRGARKNAANTRRVLRWKYTAEDNPYFGEETLPASSSNPVSDRFSVGRPLRILVNPEALSESALFCWNDLSTSARVLRVILWLGGFILAGIGIYIVLRPARKPVILVYDCRKGDCGFLHYATPALYCLACFGIVIALTRFFDSHFFLLSYPLIFFFPFLLIRLLKKKNPPVFLVVCPNPDCFSFKLTRMRTKALTQNACPACGTPLGIPPRSPEKKWKRSEIPNPRSFPQTDSLPHLCLAGWILLLVPMGYFLRSQNGPGAEAVRSSGLALLIGWGMAGMFLGPFFMEISRRWNLRKKKALVCPVCGVCLCERGNIELLRKTGHCPACGADVVESE